ALPPSFSVRDGALLDTVTAALIATVNVTAVFVSRSPRVGEIVIEVAVGATTALVDRNPLPVTSKTVPWPFSPPAEVVPNRFPPTVPIRPAAGTDPFTVPLKLASVVGRLA